MTVDITTGEIIERVSHEDARRMTEQIKLLATSIADGIDRLVERIREAQESEVHEVLGYRSWTEYVSTEFAGLLPRLDREPRRELVTTLAETGMSTRAIAPVAQVSKSQVAEDLQVSRTGHLDQARLRKPAEGPRPATEPFTCGNHCTHSPVCPPASQALGREPSPGKSRAVTGIDGKTYSQPEPTKPRRTPLPDTAWRVAYDLRKKSESLKRVIEDDRFKSNKEQIAESIRPELLLVQKAVAAALQELPEEN